MIVIAAVISAVIVLFDFDVGVVVVIGNNGLGIGVGTFAILGFQILVSAVDLIVIDAVPVVLILLFFIFLVFFVLGFENIVVVIASESLEPFKLRARIAVSNRYFVGGLTVLAL